MLAPGKLADFWRTVPEVAEVLAGGGLFSTARTIRRAGRIDAAVLLPNSCRAALEVWLAGVQRRVGYAGHRRRWLLNQVIGEPRKPALPLPMKERPHQAARYHHLAQEIGAIVPRATPEVPGAPAPGRGGWLKLALCPGAEYGPAKRWLPERFAEVAQKVAGERPCDWVLVGTAKDAPLGETIEKALEGRCENLIGKTTLAQLINALRACQLLLTNDTGTMHLAAWLGVPVVAIFGSTDPVLTGPRAPAHHASSGRVQPLFPARLSAGSPLHEGCQRRGGGRGDPGPGGIAGGRTWI